LASRCKPAQLVTKKLNLSVATVPLEPPLELPAVAVLLEPLAPLAPVL